METERLRIRHWREDEAPRLLDILSRIEVMRWLGDGEPVLLKHLDEARAKIVKYRSRDVPPLGCWAIEVRETGVPAGTVLLLELPNGAGEVEIGWHLHPDSQGHGYASEAAGAVLARAFAGGLDEVHAVTHLDNHPSMAVARRIGMRHRGVVERWYDTPSQHFTITAEEWSAGQSG